MFQQFGKLSDFMLCIWSYVGRFSLFNRKISFYVCSFTKDRTYIILKDSATIGILDVGLFGLNADQMVAAREMSFAPIVTLAEALQRPSQTYISIKATIQTVFCFVLYCQQSIQ